MLVACYVAIFAVDQTDDPAEDPVVQSAMQDSPDDEASAKNLVVELELVLVEEASIGKVDFRLLQKKKKNLKHA